MEIKLPFSGFYESVWSDMVNRAEEHEAEHLAEEEFDLDAKDIEEIIFNQAKHKECYIQIAMDYVKAFEDWLRYELGIEVTLTHKATDSPREYNFTTDRIFAEISYENVLLLFGHCDQKALAAEVKRTFTSRDGFMSFYSPRIEEWGEVGEWDHNQLGTLLETLVTDTNYEESLMEALSEKIDAAYSNCVDWEHVHHACKCKEEGREDDWEEFPRGITDAAEYVKRMEEIRGLL